MAKGRPRYILLLLLAFVIVSAIVVARRRPSPPAVQAPAPGGAAALDPGLERLVDDLDAYPLGEHVLGDLAMPRPFLRRVADRIIRASYRERFHTVYRDAAARDEQPRPTPLLDVRARRGAIEFVRTELPPEVLAARRRQPEDRPTNRGFRAPILDEARAPRVPMIDRALLTETERAAADVIATRLARDGLLATLAEVLRRLEPEAVASDEELARLERLGFPVDLLRHFGDGSAASALAAVRTHVTRGDDDEALASMPFRFVRTDAEFAAAPETGAAPTVWLRGQLTRGTYWKGIGAGGCLDVMRQLSEQLPEVPLTLSVEAQFEETLAATMRTWPILASCEVLVEPLPVAQWAHDNAKMGAVGGADGVRPALLVPRYASRREDGSLLIPGETSLLDGVAGRGHVAVHSPLIFQGGNLLCVDDPADGQRVLLVGEAEVYRNTALGLSEGQVIEAFEAELGVDRVVVLPSVSFHIDYDVSLRVHDGRLVAFVNDTDAALRLILDAGVLALRRAGVLDATASNAARRRLVDGDDRGVLDLVAAAIYGQADREQRYPLSLAEHFAVDAIDSPVGNLQRFLVALDALTSRVLADERHPSPTIETYLAAHRRTEADRQRLHESLRRLGWDVVPVPSLAEADRSVNAINGLHVHGRYLMPAYGGLYTGLDEAAAAAIGARLEGVEVIPILSGESQRRSGAVHCSVAVCPDPAAWYSPPTGSTDRGDRRGDDLRSGPAAPAATRP
jgi:hypothetical protein